MCNYDGFSFCSKFQVLASFFFFPEKLEERNGCLKQKKSKKWNEMYEMF